MKNFNATVHKTNNKYISIIRIKEAFTNEDDDGYIQIEGKTTEYCLEIEGTNSYQRALVLASKINS
jgi:hypothetical protein